MPVTRDHGGYRYGRQGKLYVGKNALAKAKRQGRAIEANKHAKAKRQGRKGKK